MSRSEMIRDLDCVVLLGDVAGRGADFKDRMFQRGTIGTVIHVYEDGAAFEVEFVDAEGQTLGFVTATRGDLRLATAVDLERRTVDAP